MISMREFESGDTDSQKADRAYIPTADSSFAMVDTSSKLEHTTTFYNKSSLKWIIPVTICIFIILFVTGLLMGRFLLPYWYPTPFDGDNKAVCTYMSGHMKGMLILEYDPATSNLTTRIDEKYLITSSGWEQMGVPYKLFVLRYSDMDRCLSKAAKPSDLFHFRPPMPPPDNSAADPTLTAKLGEIKDVALPDAHQKLGTAGAEMVNERAVTVDRKKMLLGRVVAVISHSPEKLFESQTCCVIARAGSPL